MGSRAENERKFRQWSELSTGHRIYRLDVPGRSGWSARYLKEVDDQENALRFWQEIYDVTASLVEIHQKKFPVDTGHRKV
jgi:hypothetical protein